MLIDNIDQSKTQNTPQKYNKEAYSTEVNIYGEQNKNLILYDGLKLEYVIVSV
jgi:hypothetical protein